MDMLENLPTEVNSILDTFDLDADSYHECSRIEAELLYIGYSVDWGLDGELTNLKKVEV
jgi:hypothetical protein